MKFLFIGDIVGKVGRVTTKALLPTIVNRYKIDFIIANGENLAGGFGITDKTAIELFNLGVHVITTGNHVWDKKEFVSQIAKIDNVLRPLNYPPGVPGYGSVVHQVSSEVKVAVINISGRVFMSYIDCPFRTAKDEVEKLKAVTNIIIIDFHAEATSERVAMGIYLDGRVTAMFGTHTHVATADSRILPGGTAYQTDLGMVGPQDGVLGVDSEAILKKFTTGLPTRFEVAKGRIICSGVILNVDAENGRALNIDRFEEIFDPSNEVQQDGTK